MRRPAERLGGAPRGAFGPDVLAGGKGREDHRIQGEKDLLEEIEKKKERWAES